MVKEIQLQLPPEIAYQSLYLKQHLIQLFQTDALEYSILKSSLDARKRQLKVNLKIAVYINEPLPTVVPEYIKRKVNKNKKVVIIGTGPAGLFAALKLIEKGIKPILFERGKNVKDRRRDLAKITKEQTVNPNSNYCFGEGGAGTYSDGKLYTRSKKRGNVNEILKNLVQHGAADNILYESHPHIGTNKLPKVIENIRNTILEAGGEIHFNSVLTDIILKNNTVAGIAINNEEIIETNHLILATGHSARDVFYLLHKKNILIEAKPFALGVRIEHPQSFIDKKQLHCSTSRPEYLPAASYSLVAQSGKRGVYSFCMCPGGIIAPCATQPGEIVTNGWSPSKRNNPFANSGVVVSILPEDFDPNNPLSALELQKAVEQKAFTAVNPHKTIGQKAPAQKLVDFLSRKNSTELPKCSYLPGIVSFDLRAVLPEFITKSLKDGLHQFDKKMKGYIHPEAVMVATESRTSSPVRIPRDKTSLQHVQIKGLYPCGEGAGYAGGIVSAAIDGQKCAEAISL